MKNKTLCIVDMQTRFAVREGRTLKEFKERIDEVLNIIAGAKKLKWNIVLLEFRGFGDTASAVLKALGEYDYRAITKTWDDGSDDVVSYLEAHEIKGSVYVVGANADACVLATLRGLRRKFKKGKVIAVLPAIMTFNFGAQHEWNNNGYMGSKFRAPYVESLEEVFA